MEDRKSSQPPYRKFDIERFRSRVYELKYKEDEEYYAISVDFIENLVSNIAKGEDVNCDLFEERNPLGGRLKEGLRYIVNYLAIDGEMLEEVSCKYVCSSIRVSKNTKYSSRWIIYKQNVTYCLISKDRFESEGQEEKIISNTVDLFTYNNLEDARSIILKREGLPQYFCGQFWIFTQQLPNNYSLLKERIKKGKNLISCSMLNNDPQIFKLKRRFKSFALLIEPEGEKLLPSPQIMCHSHEYRRAVYSCICQHIRSNACDKYCLDNNVKHNKKCIFVPRIDVEIGLKERNERQRIDGRSRELGLYNERNMCFFNTIVQCLAHIKRLTYFFLAYRELDELNYWNLDGTYGEVAVEYGRFIRAHCSSSNEECNMPLFETVGRWNPTYATKHQQDSHEFLIKMLDWLKEDLNLNERKPSYRNIQTSNRSEEQIVTETLKILKSRNSSIIEQLMQGIQKSVIRCTTCGYSSSTFDSFLTVQLPMSSQKRVEIIAKTCFAFYLPHSPQEKIKKFKLVYDKDDTVLTLKRQVKLLFSRSMEYEFDFYRVNQKGRVQLLNNFNFYELLSMELKDQAIFCVEKYKIGQKGDSIEVKVVFEGNESLPFSRPLYLPKEIQVQQLYVKILHPVMKCRSSQQMSCNVQNYFNKYLETDHFPFDLFLLSKGEQTPIHRIKQYKKYCFSQNDTLLVKIGKNKEFSFIGLNKYINISSGQSEKEQKKKVMIVDSSIQDCLRMYCRKELIDCGRWECSNCKVKRDAAKTLYFHRLPNVLILSLNRFKEIYESYSQTSHFHKNQSLIQYGEQLNMGKFTQSQQDQSYRLYAVANHIRLDGQLKDVRQMDGHYFAYIRTDTGWLKFDDNEVSEVSEVKVLNNKNAYILFYERM